MGGMSNSQREAPETEQHPDQLREKKACGSRRDAAHHIAIVGACPKQRASSQPEATRPMLIHEQMHGQHAQMLLPRPCHSLWHNSSPMTCPRTVSTALAQLQDGSLWGHEHQQTEDHANPQMDWKQGGAMPRGEMAGAVEVNELEHGASRGGASGTTPELDCGTDVGGTGAANTDCGTGTSKCRTREWTGLRWKRWKRMQNHCIGGRRLWTLVKTIRNTGHYAREWTALEPLKEEQRLE